MSDTDKTVVSGSDPSMPPSGDGYDGSDTEKTVVAGGGLPSMPPTSGPEKFYQIWIRAITKPNEQTYADISESASISQNQAFLWIIITSLVGNFLTLLVSSIVSLVGGQDFGSVAATLICGAPISAVIVTLIFALDVFIYQFVGKMFKGTATFQQLLKPLAAIAAPVGLISGVLGGLSSVPYVMYCSGLLTLLMVFYTIYMNIAAVKGVNKFGWGEAAGTVLIPALIFGCLCGCLVFVILTLLGPVIGDVFSTMGPGF